MDLKPIPRARTLLVCSLFIGATWVFSDSSKQAEKSSVLPTAFESERCLMDGNHRFVTGNLIHPNIKTIRRIDLGKNGQKPFATILSCSDSRVPPEVIFDQGLGDLFVVRVAGNVAGDSEVASVEYASGHLHTPLIVVMGHTKCGAVTAVVEKAHLEGPLSHLSKTIGPVAEKCCEEHPRLGSKELVEIAIRENVFQSISELLKKSKELRELVEHKKTRVIGAVYNIETGKVEWLGQHPKQGRLVTSH